MKEIAEQLRKSVRFPVEINQRDGKTWVVVRVGRTNYIYIFRDPTINIYSDLDQKWREDVAEEDVAQTVMEAVCRMKS